MCIAIAKKAGLAIDKSILETCFDNNPDGAGFCYEAEDGTLHVEKGFFTFQDFYTAYQPHEEKKALIHFRIKTHGTLHKNNTHPFIVNDKVVFIHNGIINGVPSHRTKSDTRMFKRLYLRPAIAALGEQVLQNKLFKKLIESFIGGSKLAFMIEGQPDFEIYNKQLGNMSSDGVWFSNMSWQAHPTYNYGNWKQQPNTPPQIEQPKPGWQNKELPRVWTPTQRKEVPMLDSGDEIFSFGSLVKLRWSYSSGPFVLDKGQLGEVERVYDDRTADVEFYHTGKSINVKLYQLEEIKEVGSDEWRAFCA